MTISEARHDPKRLQAVMTAAAAPDLELSFRPMFGGIMGYADGRAFASLSDMGLGLKLSGADQAALLAVEGARPLRYGPDQPPSKSYVFVPDAMLSPEAPPETLAALRVWIARSAAGLKGAEAPVKRCRKSVDTAKGERS